MLEYLKRAFWAGPQIPGLGRLPLNALALAGFGILGFAEPAFWLLGAGLEAAYLTAVSSHPRFQRLVEIQLRNQTSVTAEQSRQALIQTLDLPSRQRLVALEGKRGRVLDLAREAGEFELESSRDALDRLIWTYLKLLVARRQLTASRDQASGADLKTRIASLERDLAAKESPAALRDSQAATLRILRQRQENLESCDHTLKQVDSDLERVEAQIDLALESATVRGGGAIATANLELASQALEDLDFGESEAAVHALDAAYSAPPRSRERA